MSAQPNSPFFTTPAMERVFSLENQLRQMVRFEWALSAALESAGIAATGSAAAIEPFLDAEFVNVSALYADARNAGNLAIPFLRQLTDAVRSRSVEAARALHLGATSQDVLDTALVLQMREGLGLIQMQLKDLDAQLAVQARAHADTVLGGRTWLQMGPPVTLGLKIAGWLAALRRHHRRLEAAGESAAVLQFGGAVGTLAALGHQGLAVSSMLAQKLELRLPELPWHTHRDNLVEVATALGLLVGTLGKIARDVSLLMQSEVEELSEPFEEGRGVSSAMPHKRNPVASAIILAASNRAPGLVSTLLSGMVQEHERGLGNWQAEWETYPEIFRLAAAALDRTLEIAQRMEVDRDRMKANLAVSHGVVMAEGVSAALAEHVGRERAHHLVQQASYRAIESSRHLRDVLQSDPEVRKYLNESQIEQLMDSAHYLGSAKRFIARVLGDEEVGPT